MTRNMTSGNPLRLIWQFSLPLVFGNLFQQMYNMVDTVIVGRYLGLTSLTAVGSTSSIIFLIIGFCMGSCAGMGIPVARHFGANDHSGMRKYVMNAVYLCIFIAIGLTAVTCLLCSHILTWMSTPSDIYVEAYRYLFIIFTGIPCTILYNAVSAIIRALGDSRTPFYFLVLSTVMNVVMDLAFIVVFQMGVAGAALATILAQGISGLSCLVYMLRRYDILKCSREEKQFRPNYIADIARTGLPMGLQYAITAIGSIMLQSAVNVLGTVYVSAFTAALKVKQLAMCPFDAFATASSTFASQNLGAGNYRRIRQGLYSSILLGLIYGVGIGFVLIFAGSGIALLFVSAQEVTVLAYIQQILSFSGSFFWILAILNCTRMTIQGLGYSGMAMFAGCSELLARGMMSLVFIPANGFAAVCHTDPLAWIFATLVVIPMFFGIIHHIEHRRTRHVAMRYTS